MNNELKNILPAKIVNIIDNKNVVINKGSQQQIKKGDNFIIYKQGDEIFDLDTNESLGYLEIVIGQGTITHVQEKMATLTSSKLQKAGRKIIHRQNKNTWASLMAGITEEEIIEPADIIPFNEIELGDLAKPI